MLLRPVDHLRIVLTKPFFYEKGTEFPLFERGWLIDLRPEDLVRDPHPYNREIAPSLLSSPLPDGYNLLQRSGGILFRVDEDWPVKTGDHLPSGMNEAWFFWRLASLFNDEISQVGGNIELKEPMPPVVFDEVIHKNKIRYIREQEILRLISAEYEEPATEGDDFLWMADAVQAMYQLWRFLSEECTSLKMHDYHPIPRIECLHPLLRSFGEVRYEVVN